MASQTHIVFMNIAATGHINPTLPVVAGLVERGCKVTYFVDAALRDVVEAAGATWLPFRAPGSERTGLLFGLDAAGMEELAPEGVTVEDTGKLQGVFAYDAREVLPALLEDLRALKPAPAAIVHDTFIAAAPVAAHQLGCPAVGFVPHPGPGVLSGLTAGSSKLEAEPWVDVPRQDVLRKHGLDVLERGLALEFYSRHLNLVATIEDFFAPPSAEVQRQRFGDCPFKCIGSTANSEVKRVDGCPTLADARSEPDKLTSELDRALADGRKVVLVSMGTVATGSKWTLTLGGQAEGNDDGREGSERKALAEHTGKDICQFIYQACFDALGGDEGFLVVMAVGPTADPLEGLPPVPQNFILRQAVPQLDVLRRCSAFVTHGGANSMHEALALGVPLAVVPIFGDQPTNADSVARVGAGVSFRHPLRTLTAGSLREAVAGLARAGGPHHARAQEMKAKLAAAGGVPAACDSILDLIAQPQAPKGGA